MQLERFEFYDDGMMCRDPNGKYVKFSDIQELLSAAATLPKPIYDEAAELSKFMDHMQDKTLYVPGFKDRDDTKMQFSDDVTDTLWMGWLACAQSRAKAGENE